MSSADLANWAVTIENINEGHFFDSKRLSCRTAALKQRWREPFALALIRKPVELSLSPPVEKNLRVFTIHALSPAGHVNPSLCLWTAGIGLLGFSTFLGSPGKAA